MKDKEITMTWRRCVAIPFLALALFGCSTPLSAFKYDPAEWDTEPAPADRSER